VGIRRLDAGDQAEDRVGPLDARTDNQSALSYDEQDGRLAAIGRICGASSPPRF